MKVVDGLTVDDAVNVMQVCLHARLLFDFYWLASKTLLKEADFHLFAANCDCYISSRFLLLPLVSVWLTQKQCCFHEQFAQFHAGSSYQWHGVCHRVCSGRC